MVDVSRHLQKSRRSCVFSSTREMLQTTTKTITNHHINTTHNKPPLIQFNNFIDNYIQQSLHGNAYI